MYVAIANQHTAVTVSKTHPDPVYLRTNNPLSMLLTTIVPLSK